MSDRHKPTGITRLLRVPARRATPLAGMAKGLGSAAVMLSFALLGTVWLLVLSDLGHLITFSP